MIRKIIPEFNYSEHRPITERVSVNIFSNFKAANKKLINVLGSEKLLKDLENHHTQKVLIKMFRPSKIYASCDTVPLTYLLLSLLLPFFPVHF